MIYTVSDLHGCLEDWQTLLDTIHFSDQDTMFVLGDCVDLGPDPIGLLHDGTPECISDAGQSRIVLRPQRPDAPAGGNRGQFHGLFDR